MRNYGPEILMGLILCLALTMLARTQHTPVRASASPVAEITQTAEPEEPAPEEPVPASFDRMQTIRLQQDSEVRELSIRDYLIGVVMSEMPLSFEPEALRAQAIASRTYALHCHKHTEADVCGDGTCCQCWQDEQSLRTRFGTEYDALYEKAAQAVDDTDGTVLKYGGSLIDATYFACSGGKTEDAMAVWGREVPYLRPVNSPGEENAGNYYSRVEWEAEDFAQAVHACVPEADLAGDPAVWLGAEQRTEGDGVMTLEVGGAALSGTQLRELFHLRSTKFTVHWDGERFCFDVYGAGHRVGLSQCGAQAMALAGATAEQILRTYYTGVDISHI